MSPKLIAESIYPIQLKYTAHFFQNSIDCKLKRERWTVLIESNSAEANSGGNSNSPAVLVAVFYFLVSLSYNMHQCNNTMRRRCTRSM